MDRDFDSARREFIQRSVAALVVGSTASLAFAETGVSPAKPAHPHPELSFEARMLAKMAFGPCPRDIHAFQALGKTPDQRLHHYIEKQLHPASIPDADCEKRIAAAHLTTLKKSLTQLWRDHSVAADALRDNEMAPKPGPAQAGAFKGGDAAHMQEPPHGPKQEEIRLRHQPARETEIATWLKAVYSKRQLQEVLADFWHNHFNVFAWDPKIAPVFVHYDRDVIRAHMLGNFRELLEAVTKSPAMLFYLDGFVNQSGNPNENFARELFELHTLGAEHYLGTRDRAKVPGYAEHRPVGYVDGDVYEAARAFTGWRVDQGKNSGDTGEFQYWDAWHDRFQKIVLGHPLKEYQPPMKDGNDVLDLLAEHPGTAEHIARKLCRRFIGDRPPERVVKAAAKVFHDERKAKDQLRRVVRTVLLSPEFRSTFGEKMKRPFEAAAGMLRATEAEFFPTEPFLNLYQRAGQRLFAWRSPDGYPDVHERWAGTTPLLERWRFANILMAGGIKGVRVPQARKLPAKAPNRETIVHEWGSRLLGRPLEPAHHAAVTSFLAEARNPGELRNRMPAAVALILMSPELQLR